jgi:hypothetical protein
MTGGQPVRLSGQPVLCNRNYLVPAGGQGGQSGGQSPDNLSGAVRTNLQVFHYQSFEMADKLSGCSGADKLSGQLFAYRNKWLKTLPELGGQVVRTDFFDRVGGGYTPYRGYPSDCPADKSVRIVHYIEACLHNEDSQ